MTVPQPNAAAFFVRGDGRLAPHGLAVLRGMSADVQSRGVSVRRFGAVGDGITDDWRALQAAIDAEPRLYFPPGSYRVSQLVRVRSGQALRGAGRSSVLRRAPSGGSHVIAGPSGGIQDFNLLDLCIDVNGTVNTGAGHGVTLPNAERVRIDGLTVINAATYAVAFQTGARDVDITRLRLENCTNDGVDFKNPDNTNRNIRIFAVQAVDCGMTESQKAVIDIRGTAFVSDVWATWSGATGGAAIDVVRLRHTGSGLIGGERSRVENVRLYGNGQAGQKCLSAQGDNIDAAGLFAIGGDSWLASVGAYRGFSLIGGHAFDTRHALALNGTIGATLISVHSDGHTSDAFQMSGATDCTLIGCSGRDGFRGYTEINSAARNRLISCDFSGNSAGDVVGLSATSEAIWTAGMPGPARLILPEHADNAAAVAAGLGVGDLYRTSGGEVRVRV